MPTGMQLTINHLRERAKTAPLQKLACDAINTKLWYNQATDVEETKSDPLVSLEPAKWVIYIQKLRGMKDENYRHLKWTLNKLKVFLRIM